MSEVKGKYNIHCRLGSVKHPKFPYSATLTITDTKTAAALGFSFLWLLSELPPSMYPFTEPFGSQIVLQQLEGYSSGIKC